MTEPTCKQDEGIERKFTREVIEARFDWEAERKATHKPGDIVDGWRCSARVLGYRGHRLYTFEYVWQRPVYSEYVKAVTPAQALYLATYEIGEKIGDLVCMSKHCEFKGPNLFRVFYTWQREQPKQEALSFVYYVNGGE